MIRFTDIASVTKNHNWDHFFDQLQAKLPASLSAEDKALYKAMLPIDALKKSEFHGKAEMDEFLGFVFNQLQAPNSENLEELIHKYGRMSRLGYTSMSENSSIGMPTFTLKDGENYEYGLASYIRKLPNHEAILQNPDIKSELASFPKVKELVADDALWHKTRHSLFPEITNAPDVIKNGRKWFEFATHDAEGVFSNKRTAVTAAIVATIGIGTALLARKHHEPQQQQAAIER